MVSPYSSNNNSVAVRFFFSEKSINISDSTDHANEYETEKKQSWAKINMNSHLVSMHMGYSYYIVDGGVWFSSAISPHQNHMFCLRLIYVWVYCVCTIINCWTFALQTLYFVTATYCVCVCKVKAHPLSLSFIGSHIPSIKIRSAL